MKLFAILVSGLLLAGTALAQDTHISAVVNDDVITTADLEARTQLQLRASGLKDSAENRQRLAPRVLRTLIDEKLQLQEAKRLNVTVPQEEIDQALARIEQQNNMGKGGLDKYLAAAGISRGALVDQLTASLTWGKLVQNRLSQDVTVTDEEVADAMKRYKESVNLPLTEVSEIFLAIDNPGQEEEVKRLADRLEEQIRAGTGGNFATIAQQFSQSPTAAVGGDLGWITPNDIAPSLAQAIAQMKPGEISQPIRGAGGYYILAVSDRRLPGQGNPAEAEVSVVEAGAPVPASASAEFRARLDSALRQLIAAASSCPAFTQAAHKIGLPFVKEAMKVRAATLSPIVRRIMVNLTPGQVSRPFPVEGGVGVIILCERKDASAPQAPTPDQIRDTIGRERLDVLARRYLRDLRRGAYVDVRG